MGTPFPFIIPVVTGSIMVSASSVAAQHLWSLYGLIMEGQTNCHCFRDLFSPIPGTEKIVAAMSAMNSSFSAGVTEATFRINTHTNTDPTSSAAQYHALVVLVIALTISEVLALLTYKVLNLCMDWYTMLPNVSTNEQDDQNTNSDYDAYYFPYWPPYWQEDERDRRLRKNPAKRIAKIKMCLNTYKLVEYKTTKSLMLCPCPDITVVPDTNIPRRTENLNGIKLKRDDSCAICLNDYGKFSL